MKVELSTADIATLLRALKLQPKPSARTRALVSRLRRAQSAAQAPPQLELASTQPNKLPVPFMSLPGFEPLSTETTPFVDITPTGAVNYQQPKEKWVDG